MRIGLVIVIARADDARNAKPPADSAGVRCRLPGQALAHRQLTPALMGVG